MEFFLYAVIYWNARDDREEAERIRGSSLDIPQITSGVQKEIIQKMWKRTNRIRDFLQVFWNFMI